METQPRRAYPTDLKDKQWTRVAPLFPLPSRPRGRPRAWTYGEILVVERTFGGLGRYRRLSKDFEPQVHSSEAMAYLASIHRMLRLLDG